MDKDKKTPYQLTSLKEPTDKQLSSLMKEVAAEAKSKSEAANEKFFQHMFDYIDSKKKEWEKKYDITFENA